MRIRTALYCALASFAVLVALFVTGPGVRQPTTSAVGAELIIVVDPAPSSR